MQIDFSDKPRKLPIASKPFEPWVVNNQDFEKPDWWHKVSKPFEPWVVNNQDFEKPDWWHKVTYQLKVLYYNHGPKILETVIKVEDYLIHP